MQLILFDLQSLFPLTLSMTVNDKLAAEFINYLRHFAPLTDAEIRKDLIPILKIREYGKKQIITQSGDVEDHMNFITKGLIRKYYKKGAEENIVQLSIEGHLISCQESFYTRTPSEYILETIEPSTIISMTYGDMEKMFQASHNLERVGRLVIAQIMVLKDKWQTSLIMDSPRDRFLLFVENYPEIIQRVPQKYLASYLNIKPETFSRFKHLLRKKKPTTIPS
ncbi:MAG TPA: Crp/Fnr family transcriptional regulator [Niabella sp.]|nr:Crp/Fnr family transcriptional regulator [Niabella sp.]HQX20728.1 Crp/Fnr family transcriptional regulator [Niabella sp.]HRB07159.1 Crp/Fnr family transcriptional regulator [Niabella sp.]HRB49888.1 Crp/Fnr family transcriptional regulator [Niabella sp.]HRC10637.1 Crp/Fnr family transcriptional regulator [Niabella sp.]